MSFFQKFFTKIQKSPEMEVEGKEMENNVFAGNRTNSQVDSLDEPSNASIVYDDREDSKTVWLEGNVNFFKEDEGWGFIDCPEYGKIFFHVSNVERKAKSFIQGESVKFAYPEKNDKGFITKYVAPKRARYKGIVLEYNSGKGKIKCDELDREIFLKDADIEDSKERKYLDPDEEVEFFIEKDETGRFIAKQLTHDTRPALMRFSQVKNFDDLLEDLKGIAQAESWNYENESNEHRNPILYNYIIYTFERIYKEGNISYTEDNYAACFNTGLLTDHLYPVYGVFHRNNYNRGGNWNLKGFYKDDDYEMNKFPVNKRPSSASYFNEPSDLIYDIRLGPPKINLQHIGNERFERLKPFLPFSMDTDSKLLDNNQQDIIRRLLDATISDSFKRVRCNYKTAVPQFYKGRLQLLLPLCFKEKKKADLALAVNRLEGIYRGYTILTLPMAYNNARLIARPDSYWLKP